ncbi:MAG: alpha/beta hydrolase [Bacteroidetes bacterium]|jgi:pimeloyl-ACP methyl ester carboxylesterase|nr:alpha/beta hydrolase [Bacteroidota bacterium]
MKIYFISGLAADSRVFKYLRLPIGFEPVYLDWIHPEKKESLRDYSWRLAEKINTQEPFAILGLSMGGMMATEIALKWEPVLTILISSVPVSSNLPFYFRAIGKLGLQKMVPISMVKSMSIIKRLFTAETEEDKNTIKQIIYESDKHFIRWAMDAILKWENNVLPSPYIHIHGSRDEVLPIRFTRPTYTIAKAGHLMVMTNAKELSEIIGKELNKLVKS